MPSNTLTCPHCGHDGTAETSKPPLHSHGFNFLADGIVCREVRGYDEAGRLRLSGDARCEGSPATNAKVECRSCWQTFPVPEGLQWAAEADQPAQGAAAQEESPLATASSYTKTAAETIAQNLILILRNGMQHLERSSADEIARLEASIAGVGQAAGEAQQQLLSRVVTLEAAFRAQEENQPKLWEGLSVLRTLQEDGLRKLDERAAATAGLQDSLKGRIDELDSGLRTEKETSAQLGALCSQLQADQRSMQQRLDAQADVIRELHASAQEHMSRKQELRAAVQRLEEIAGALDQVKPLPKEL